MFKLMKEMEHLEFMDSDIWQKCFDTISHKKRINNLTFLDYFNQVLRKFNSDPKGAFFKKLDSNIEKLGNHMNQNRKWRYDFENAKMYSLDELIARREETKYGDTVTSRGGED